jgi:hypothetical protein
MTAIALAAPLVAHGATAERWQTFTVPTGGFTVDLPASWIDATSASPSLIKALAANPALRATAEYAKSTNAYKFVAVSSDYRAYFDVAATRVGSASLSSLAAQTAPVLRKAGLLDGKMTSTRETLPAGHALRLSWAATLGGKHVRSIIYALKRGANLYEISFAEPDPISKSDESLVERSARSFRFRPPADLSHVILSAAQVGQGYVRKLLPGGDSVIDETTLDLCNGTFPSEALRTDRLQTTYTRSGSSLYLSNEVVDYVSGGADQALQEVGATAAACEQKPSVQKQGSVVLTISAKPLHTTGLTPGAIAVRLEIVSTDGKKKVRETGIAVYQVEGDTLSGVYTFESGANGAKAIALGLRAAAASAANLRSGSLKS